MKTPPAVPWPTSRQPRSPHRDEKDRPGIEVAGGEVAAPGLRETPIEALAYPVPAERPQPRLLACDVDGTLLDERGVLRPAVRDAIALIRNAGVDVVLATGRSPWAGLAKLCDDLGLDGPQITMQGALIISPRTGEIVRARRLSAAVFRDHLSFARALELTPIVALADGHRAETLPANLGLFVPPLREGTHFELVDSFERIVNDGPIRTFLPTHPDRHRSVRMLASVWFGSRASIVWSDDSGIELLAPGASKGDALRYLAGLRGLGLESVAAVGDAPNDTEMLRVAGWSAAMGSAPETVQRAADLVVPPSSEEGILDAFRHFFPDLRFPRRRRAPRTAA